MRISITKDHIGKTVYGYPTGDNARHGGVKQGIKKFAVVGFGRKYAKVLCNNSDLEISVHPFSGDTQEEIIGGYCNAGYMFFDSESDCYEYIKIIDARKAVLSKMSRCTIKKLSDALVLEIAKQLGIEV